MKPFQGITFCPTGFNDESCSRNISKKIVKLGGFFNRDLTLQVNVLVIGKTKDTKKYKFAVRHRQDIIFVSTESVESIYQRWLAGEELSGALDLLRSRYSLPPLDGVYVFIGRVDDQICTLQRLEQLCYLQGCFKCNSTHFTKDCQTKSQGTLVVFVSDSLDGIRVKAAMELGIPIIHPKWVLDCHKRNALLEFDPYYLLETIEPGTTLDQIGINSCDCWDSLAEPISVIRDPTTNSVTRTNPRIKFKPQGDKLWRRAMSNAPQLSLSSPTSAPITPQLPKEEIEESNLHEKDSTVHYIFQDITFNIDSKFSQHHATILQKVIEQQAGILSKDSAQYHIIPSNCPIEGIDSHGVVTEFFIERCLHYKKLIDPPDSWCKPFLRSLNVILKPSQSLLHDNKSNFLKVSITGFKGVELLHLTKILKIMEPLGIKFTEYLNSSTDLLLINLSSLPSIPTSHPLWKNKYGDLFHLQAKEDEKSKTSNQVFRNSMKRKIEFVKQKHSIPVVTPAFLMNLLAHSSGLHSSEKSTVYLNNINWCIICPRGTRENFAIDILPKKGSQPPFFSRESSSVTPSIKESGLEVLSKVNQVSHSKVRTNPPKRPDYGENNPGESPSKRHQPEKKNDRVSSWGNLMSEEANNVGGTDLDFDPIEPTPGNVDVNFTQVTYGNSAQDVNQGKIRRLTRKQMKELGS
ncbi:hypothetical protein ZYGR_0AD03910 [Zygosaccharomyces rouxii]|uniref:ZYRO0G15180p n=2 Tax=Zygosaccharomyces rouxii TaxID=4956 RepID=C5E0S3_ZYGRC|nr:uncharacterized protein ZYRO0G15180g [Zygosaccharomyces rouxii]KAH9202701.1 hypothetical protein LQ764DRAFT_207663 [Zygosaccharomyces rouxii]GAV51208.1 hypothetical protein ZYGR_0AD03910 [Zygosaccharomyces rouxii]CAR29707.1 ZYRO0G15180p [Zygosaccharomyces rouxii]